MPQFLIQCQYCGKERIQAFYSAPDKDMLRCYVCDEKKNLKIKKVETSNVFGYSEEDKKPDAYFRTEDDDDNWKNWPE